MLPARLALLLAAAAMLPGASPAVQVQAELLLARDAPVLADYGLFDADGRPAPGVTAYTLNTPLFSDGAEKFRYVWLPPGTRADYRPSGALAFPVGAVLIKRFAFAADARQPGRDLTTIETRLLIHRPGGWAALSYVQEGTQAVLKRAGKRIAVATTNSAGQPQTIDYAVPNQNQCKQCHQAGDAITPIGPTAGNLNGNLNNTGRNQLLQWAAAGRLAGLPAAGGPNALPRLARWDDMAEPLAARARAYLAVNCGHCHDRAGFASNSGLYLGPDEQTPAHLGIRKRPVAAGRGSGGREFSILPGQPEHSILLYRMESVEPGVMMPQFGRTLVHAEGAALIRQWIAALPDAGQSGAATGISPAN